MLGAVVPAHAQDFKKQVIYEIITDRFVDGDTSNDNPSESPGLYDSTQTNWQAYWGGDLAGIQSKMAYLKGMGVTAIWISPPVNGDNLNPMAPQVRRRPGTTGTGRATFSRWRSTLAMEITPGARLTRWYPPHMRTGSRWSPMWP